MQTRLWALLEPAIIVALTGVSWPFFAVMRCSLNFFCGVVVFKAPYVPLKREEMTEGRKAGWVRKLKPAPSLAQSLDPPLVTVLVNTNLLLEEKAGSFNATNASRIATKVQNFNLETR